MAEFGKGSGAAKQMADETGKILVRLDYVKGRPTVPLWPKRAIGRSLLPAGAYPFVSFAPREFK